MALSTFIISTYDWKDEGKKLIVDGNKDYDENAILRVRYDYVIGNVKTAFETMKPALPAGRPEDNNVVNISARITDIYGGYSTCVMSATVGCLVKCIMNVSRFDLR